MVLFVHTISSAIEIGTGLSDGEGINWVGISAGLGNIVPQRLGGSVVE